LRVRYILVLLAIFIVLGGVYCFFSRSTTAPPAQSKTYLWNIADSDLRHIVITLPREGKSQAFIKISEGDKFPWFFDDPQKSPVDSQRWGGGIPLILSGPGADRIIAEDATDDQMANYGLTQPSMEIILTVVNGDVLKIYVGNSTPNGYNYYVRPPNSYRVAIVDSTWYGVLKNLVINPPYAPAVK
jgi:hypothetical protein